MLKLSRRTHISKLVFSPDSRSLFAIGGQGTAVSVWDLQAGKLDQKIYMPPFNPDINRKVSELAFCRPDKLILGSYYGSYPIRIWDWPIEPNATPKDFKTEGYRYTLESVLDDTHILVRHYDSSIHIWNPTTNDVHLVRPLHWNCFFSTALKNDGRLLGWVTPSSICTQKIVDRSNFQLDAQRSTVAIPHGGNLIRFHPSENRLAVAYQTSIRVFDCETLEPIGSELPLTKPAKAIEFTPDGNQLIIATGEGLVQIWNANSFEQIASYDFGVKSIKCLAVAPDGLTCAIGGRFQEIVVIDLES